MKNTAKNTFHSCTAYMLSFLCPTLLQHQSSNSKRLQNIISEGEMEEENWGESKQQMNCSQFEVGKSPFIPSLHFLLLSSSLHSGSSPLGERSEWKRWAESRPAAERHGTLGHVSTTYPSTWSCGQDPPSDILLIKSLGVWAQKMCHHPQKSWKLERMRSLPPLVPTFSPLSWPVSAHIIKWTTQTLLTLPLPASRCISR